MTDSSRAQGGLICAGVVVVGLIFLLGILSGSYWALAIPVAALVFFVLGLTFWVGWTIATIRVLRHGGSKTESPSVAIAPLRGGGSMVSWSSRW